MPDDNVTPIFQNLQYICNACDQKNMVNSVARITMDVSKFFKLETGTVCVFLKYCKNNPDCMNKVIDQKFVAKKIFGMDI